MGVNRLRDRVAGPEPARGPAADLGVRPGVRPTNVNLNLRIEELALDGFPPADRYAIGDALERELARLVAERGVPPLLERGGDWARMDGGSFPAAAGSRPETIGVKVARTLYARFER